MSKANEVFISVDIETSGPIPGDYSMLSIGASLISAPTNAFYAELKPITMNFVPEALAVTGFSLDELITRGETPESAMTRFETWIRASLEGADTPIFVGLNAPFDWSFVNYYFHRFRIGNPFGFTALDIKAFFMGAMGCSWRDTRSSAIAKYLKLEPVDNHNALQDALYQAELFRLLLNKAARPTAIDTPDKG
ncbi:exonuclease domain-containing protein [Bordetella bronchialis]|uniref:3'-5' exonuclease n=1 Tax=Bordetella bronchialis TaxID=463025 RepID=UPI003D062BBF